MTSTKMTPFTPSHKIFICFSFSHKLDPSSLIPLTSLTSFMHIRLCKEHWFLNCKNFRIYFLKISDEYWKFWTVLQRYKIKQQTWKNLNTTPTVPHPTIKNFCSFWSVRSRGVLKINLFSTSRLYRNISDT